MYKIALIFPAILFCQIAAAQVTPKDALIGVDAQQNLFEMGNPPTSSVVRVYDDRYEGVKGTPFFYKDWTKATIAANNTLYDNLEVKYNVNDNEILYRNPDGKEFVLKPQHVDSFTLKDGKSIHGVVFKKFAGLVAQDPKFKDKFAVALYEGTQMQLVLVPQKTFIKANYEGAYSSGNRFDELRNEQDFYLIGPANMVSKVKLSKKTFLKALPAKQNQVGKYIETQRLDMNSENGWIKALAYYETL